MTTFTLNIGLTPSKHTTNKEPITRSEVLAALRGAGITVRYYRVAQSETEPTAVVVAESNYLYVFTHLYNVSVALRQDCIAARDNESGKGHLIGPNAAEWGEFNPAYFIEYNTFTDIAA